MAGASADSRDGAERFWRNIFGGMASARFHRPPSGLGLSETAQAHLKSARMLTDVLNVFEAVPENSLLSRREANEAYTLAGPDVAAVFFPDGGEVDLNVSSVGGGRPLSVRWLDVRASRWQEPAVSSPEDGRLELMTPGEGFWVVLVRAQE